MMEDEEEIHPQRRIASSSSTASPQNQRLLLTGQPVTVAAAPPQHILTLALPIQQPRTTTTTTTTTASGGGGGGGREDCWSEGATSTLIDAWGERYLELSRGNLKQKHWKEVAEIVSSREDYNKLPKTDVQCKNRIDTLKKKYKAEKAKISYGQGPSKWVFFHRIDQLIGPNAAKIPPGISNAACMPTTPIPGTKIPTAIPVSFPPFRKSQQQKPQYGISGSMDSSSSRSETAASPDSTDSFPPETFNRKRPRIEQNAGKGNRWGNSIRELTQAILEFGEAYERTETSKLGQVVEMEKQRMGFAKELELQRMQFFMKTQLELSQLKHGRRIGSNVNHHHNNNNRNKCD